MQNNYKIYLTYKKQISYSYGRTKQKQFNKGYKMNKQDYKFISSRVRAEISQMDWDEAHNYAHNFNMGSIARVIAFYKIFGAPLAPETCKYAKPKRHRKIAV